jgi:hypothetical protein
MTAFRDSTPFRPAPLLNLGVRPPEVRAVTEAEWLACDDPDRMLDSRERRQSSARKLNLLACACCRRVIDLLPGPHDREALEDAERMAGAERDAILAHARGSRLWRLHPADIPAVWRAVFYHYAVGYAPSRCADVREALEECRRVADADERAAQAALCRCVLGDPLAHLIPDPTPTGLGADIDDFLRAHCAPFRPAVSSWLTETVLSLARQAYESREFTAMPILADALQDAGCDSDDILSHCRDTSLTHARGCWVVDLVLGKG